MEHTYSKKLLAAYVKFKFLYFLCGARGRSCCVWGEEGKQEKKGASTDGRDRGSGGSFPAGGHKWPLFPVQLGLAGFLNLGWHCSTLSTPQSPGPLKTGCLGSYPRDADVIGLVVG